jgi:SAM-dependent methyltransferase
MTVKEHYDNHLGYFYSWMAGDFQTKCMEFKQILHANTISPTTNKIAIDLGAGHGIQSIPLAQLGFKVVAVDFNQQLLDELKTNAQNLDVTIINNDIRNINHFGYHPELVVCCGDTLSHLNSKIEVDEFIANIVESLSPSGKIIFSFRDYSNKLEGIERFIPVKSDENKILTCVLDYEDDYVNVTDLLYEKTENKWTTKVSSYKKVRLITNNINDRLENFGMHIDSCDVINRLVTIIATKA